MVTGCDTQETSETCDACIWSRGENMYRSHDPDENDNETQIERYTREESSRSRNQHKIRYSASRDLIGSEPLKISGSMSDPATPAAGPQPQPYSPHFSVLFTSSHKPSERKSSTQGASMPGRVLSSLSWKQGALGSRHQKPTCWPQMKSAVSTHVHSQQSPPSYPEKGGGGTGQFGERRRGGCRELKFLR